VYARTFEGYEEPFAFGVSGKLIRNALVMYDRTTDSLWSQFLGVAVEGELEGTPLEPVPSTLTDWATWLRLHPDTLVLDQGGPYRDAYDSYYRDGSAGVIGEANRDDRLARKEFVLGLQLPDHQRAYAFRDLSAYPVVNDRLGNTELVVVFDAGPPTGVAFDRVLDGRTLTFDQLIDPARDDILLLDRETLTVWHGLTGEAIEGKLAGAQLRQLTLTQLFWFSWTDFYEDGPLWAPPS